MALRTRVITGQIATLDPVELQFGVQPDFAVIYATHTSDMSDVDPDAGIMIGFATRATSQFSSVSVYDADGLATTDSYTYSNDSLWQYRDETSAVLFQVSSLTWTARGLSFTPASISGTITYTVLLGEANNAELLVALSPTATGTEAKSLATGGFTPNLLLTLGTASLATLGGIAEARFGFGAGVVGDGWSAGWSSDHGVATSDTNQRMSANALTCMTPTGPLYQTDVDSFSSGGWTWDWVAAPGTARAYHVLALNVDNPSVGIESAPASDETENTELTGGGDYPVAGGLFGATGATADDTNTDGTQFSVGMADGRSGACVGLSAQHNVGTSNTQTVLRSATAGNGTGLLFYPQESATSADFEIVTMGATTGGMSKRHRTTKSGARWGYATWGSSDSDGLSIGGGLITHPGMSGGLNG